MKKSTKKIYATLTAMAMVASLAACGSVEPFFATALPGLGMGSGGMMAPPAATEPPAPTDTPAEPTDTPSDPTDTPTPGEEDKTVLYVATDGNDANNGSLDKPFATLSRAIEAARTVDETVVINLRGGSYKAAGTIELTEADSNLVIRSYPGETAEITGGTKIPFSAFSQTIDGDLLERIDTVPRWENWDGTMKPGGMDGFSLYINVLQADLKALGITDYGVVYDLDNERLGSSLNYNGEQMPLACYPNEGFLKVDNVDRNDQETVLTFNGLEERIQRWTQAKDVWISGRTDSSYRSSTLPVVVKEEGKIAIPSRDRVNTGDARLKIMNVIEELDSPGEWYLDRDTGYLYIIAPKDFSVGEELVFSSFNQDFIKITGASNIVIEGIHFANTAARAINVKSSDSIVVNACEFNDINRQVMLVSESTNTGIQNSSIHDIGNQAITMLSCGDLQTLTPSNNFVKNTLIEKACQVDQGKYCIDINGCVGITVSHNEIHDVPIWGIIYNESNDITIEYNELYKMCYNGDDCGAIYCGRNWTTRGNVVRYNYIHDCLGSEMRGVYLDDLHSSTEVYGNVFQKVQYAVTIGGGRDNKVVNNLIVDSMFVVLTDNRGVGNPWIEEGGYVYNMLMAVPYKDGIWAERYPELVNILEDEPGLPKRNVIKNNVQYLSSGRIQEYGGLLSNGAALNEDVVKYGTVENNITLDGTTSFANYALNDLTILEGSELKAKLPEFEIIPFKEIGRYDYSLDDNYSKNKVEGEEEGVKQSLKMTAPIN